MHYFGLTACHSCFQEEENTLQTPSGCSTATRRIKKSLSTVLTNISVGIVNVFASLQGTFQLRPHPRLDPRPLAVFTISNLSDIILKTQHLLQLL